MPAIELGLLTLARPYVIVGAFVIAAVVTPPDLISLFVLAMPMWLLFELGLLISRFVTQSAPAEPASDYQPPTDAETERELDRAADESGRNRAGPQV